MRPLSGSFTNFTKEELDEGLNQIQIAFSPGGCAMPYTRNQLGKIAKSFGKKIGDLPLGFLIILSNAVSYHRHEGPRFSSKGRREQKKLFKMVEASTASLLHDLEQLRELYPHGYSLLNDFSHDDGAVDVEALASSLKTYNEHANKFLYSTPPGRPKDGLTPIFVLFLARLYYDMKQQWPRRSHNPVSGKDYGDFHDFVIAALEPIDPQRCSAGMDDVIRNTLKHAAEDERQGIIGPWSPMIPIMILRLMGKIA